MGKERTERFHCLGLAAWLACAAIGGALGAQTVQVRAKVSETLRGYQPSAAVKGTLEIPAADAFSDLGDEWNRAFRKFQPQARLAFHYMLTKDAVKGFLEGSVPLILVSRELQPAELAAFQARFDYRPIRVPVCMDANIIIVNRANPITAISMQQLDAIYSSERRGGAPAPARMWGDLGVTGELAQAPINAYAWPDGAAIRGSFAALALQNGTYRAGILERPDSAALAESVHQDLAGIAFGSIASWFAATKTLPVIPYGSTTAYPPTDDLYPMHRIFCAYLNRRPGQPAPPALVEALRFFVAREGQNTVADVGLLPAPPEFMAAGMGKLED
jgi:phosphate transport system substrate-binding protein